jgi:hypothetical protein
MVNRYFACFFYQKEKSALHWNPNFDEQYDTIKATK